LALLLIRWNQSLQWRNQSNMPRRCRWCNSFNSVHLLLALSIKIVHLGLHDEMMQRWKTSWALKIMTNWKMNPRTLKHKHKYKISVEEFDLCALNSNLAFIICLASPHPNNYLLHSCRPETKNV
jgi:hypothetical protein